MPLFSISALQTNSLFGHNITKLPGPNFRRCSLLRSRFLALSLSLGLLLALSGCQKAADQSASTDSGTGDSSGGSTGSSGTSSKSSLRAALSPKPITVPVDTTISVALDESIGSKTSSSGQNFSATLSAPIEVNGRVVIPKGARATGIVRDAKSAGRFKGGAVLSVSLASVAVNDKNYDVQTSDFTQTSKGKGKRTAVMIGGGGAAGALIGGLAGGGKGAAIGAAVGAGGGTAGAGLTGNREIAWPAETPLTFKLLQPVEIKSR